MIDIFNRVLLLKHGEVFSQVSTENLKVVAGELIVEDYLKGERVFDLNDHSDKMYIIGQGKVGISLNKDPELKSYFNVLGPGECFGEMGIIDDLPRSATVHVVENTTLLVLEKSRFIGLISRYPELAMGIMRSISARLRKTTDKLRRYEPEETSVEQDS